MIAQENKHEKLSKYLLFVLALSNLTDKVATQTSVPLDISKSYDRTMIGLMSKLTKRCRRSKLEIFQEIKKQYLRNEKFLGRNICKKNTFLLQITRCGWIVGTCRVTSLVRVNTKRSFSGPTSKSIVTFSMLSHAYHTKVNFANLCSCLSCCNGNYLPKTMSPIYCQSALLGLLMNLQIFCEGKIECSLDNHQCKLACSPSCDERHDLKIALKPHQGAYKAC